MNILDIYNILPMCANILQTIPLLSFGHFLWTFSLPKKWKANTGPYLFLSVYLSLLSCTMFFAKNMEGKQGTVFVFVCIFVIVIVIVILYNFLCQKHGRRTRDCFRPSGFWLMHHYCYPCDLNNDTRQIHMFLNFCWNFIKRISKKPSNVIRIQTQIHIVIHFDIWKV